MCVMVDYVKEMALKKSCKYGSLESVLFLFDSYAYDTDLSDQSCSFGLSTGCLLVVRGIFMFDSTCKLSYQIFLISASIEVVLTLTIYIPLSVTLTLAGITRSAESKTFCFFLQLFTVSR